MGGEVLLEAAAHDRRLAAVVSDGAARPMDQTKVNPPGALAQSVVWLAEQSGRAISGMKPSRSLVEFMPAIAPRPVLLVAAGKIPEEPPASRMYQRAGGDNVKVWVAPDAVHIGAIRKHPAEYEQRTVGFLDAAL